MYKGPNFTYECAPVIGVNATLPEEERCIVKLTCASYMEQNAETIENMKMQSTEDRTKWGQLNSERTFALAAKHFKGAVNVNSQCLETTDLNEFVEQADPKLVEWMFAAVMRAELLTLSEIKNSEPVLDGE